MAEITPDRTPIEQLLIELLYQTISAESSDAYIASRLRRAGLSEREITEVMDAKIGLDS